LIFFVDSVWKAFTDTTILPQPRNPSTYLLVHDRSGLKNQYMVFKKDELHAEQNFMEAHRNQDKYRTENEPLKKIDMYFTLAPCGAQEMDCAQQLRDFAQDCNFELNIKVAAPYQKNKEKLSYLMTSEYCTVRAFTEKDYKKLAGYLGVTNYSRQTPAMKKKDDETQLKLKQIRYSKYDHTYIYILFSADIQVIIVLTCHIV